MNEITTYSPPSQDMSVVRESAAAMADAAQLASGLCMTSFVPSHFRGKPEEAAAAILYGASIGLDPLTSLQQIYSIGGKPALYARAMCGIAIGQGHEIWTEEDTGASVTVCGRRKGSDKVERVTWTLERAQRAGYTSNKNYQKDPHAMLYARASGDVARRIAPDALMGLAMREEAPLIEAEVTRAAPPSRGAAALADRIAPPDEPPADDYAEIVEDAN